MKTGFTLAIGSLVAVTLAGCGSDESAAISTGSTATSGTGSAQGGAGGTGSGGSPGTTSSAATSSGNTGGAGTGGVSAGGAATGGASTGGAGNCIGCSDILQGGDPADACTMNGPPSSATIWTDFSTCLCVDNCGQQCAQACQGGQPTAECQQCAGQNCFAEFQACNTDGGNVGNCDTCSDVLQGNGMPMNLCAPSQPIFQAVFDCTCVNSCQNECGDNICMGGGPNNACQGCLQQNCAAQIQACFMDN